MEILQLLSEMDQKVNIKEEQVWLEEIASTSFPSADVKDELIIEEPTLDQLLPCFKEEEKWLSCFEAEVLSNCSRLSVDICFWGLSVSCRALRYEFGLI
ncbi:uncharacterized protein [Anabrus simplex]|uniref:uncharacterized protein isoform X2 n=1 Tax=Anabrus simplex TaxID=316456 RepID=UPI0034DD0F65